MALSLRSVDQLTTALSDDFNEYLAVNYGDQLNEILANAANNFLQESLGEVEDDLFYDLALGLMDSAELN